MVIEFIEFLFCIALLFVGVLFIYLGIYSLIGSIVINPNNTTTEESIKFDEKSESWKIIRQEKIRDEEIQKTNRVYNKFMLFLFNAIHILIFLFLVFILLEFIKQM